MGGGVHHVRLLFFLRQTAAGAVKQGEDTTTQLLIVSLNESISTHVEKEILAFSTFFFLCVYQLF